MPRQSNLHVPLARSGPGLSDWSGTSRYEILRLIGRGGMGVVYEALDRERHRLVALKTLRHSSPAALYLFKREFRTLADVHHPNLVQLHELVVAEADRAFFTMELVRGSDFVSHVGASPSRLRPALRQLVEGVRALHRAGKLHRDIKPSNVQVTHDGRVVLLDFGVATELAPVSAGYAALPEETAGTARYMAPELPAGEAPTAACDWYSVGVMLGEALGEGGPADLRELQEQLVARDPALRPSGAEIASRLDDGPAGPGAHAARRSAPPPERSATFVGRESSLASLREALEEVRRDARCLTVHVACGPGLGKSALVHHFLDESIAGRRAIVLRGRAYERESVPYRAMDSVVDALSLQLLRMEDAGLPLPLPPDTPALGRLFPVLLRVPAVRDVATPSIGEPHRVRARAFGALRELLGSLARRQPLIVFIDDAHWGDADSASLVLELVRPPDPPPILLVLAYRDAEAQASPFLAETRVNWPDGAPVRQIPIGPLEADDARQLAVALLGTVGVGGAGGVGAAEASAAIAAESGGSPFLLEELARSDASARPRRGPLTIEGMVSERLARLSEDARRVLEVVSVGAGALPLSIVAEASGVHDGLSEAIASARVNRFVRAGLRHGREVIEASHDRIRHTIVAQLPEAMVREYHRRLALALSSTEGIDPEAVAIHFLGAGEPERAARFAERAAEEAEDQLAFDRAAGLYGVALENLPDGAPQERRLRERRGRVLEWAGRGVEAARAYLEAAESEPPDGRVALERAAAEQLLASGHIDDGAEHLRRVLRAVGAKAPRSPLSAIVWLLAHWVAGAFGGLHFAPRLDPVRPRDRQRIDALYSFVIGFSIVDVVVASCMQARHLLLALRAGDTSDVLRAASIELTHTANRGGPVGRRERELLGLLDRLSQQTDDAESLAFVQAARGVRLLVRGSWRQAVEILDRAYANVSARRASWQSQAEVFAMLALYTMGDLATLDRRQARLLADADLRGDLYTSVSLRTVTVPAMCLARDQPDEARRHVREAMEQWSHRGFLLQHWQAMRAEAEIELYVGQPRRARERLARDARALRRSYLMFVQYARVVHLSIVGRCAVADAASRETAAERQEPLRAARRRVAKLRRENTAHARALAALLSAGIASIEGDREGAIMALREAVVLAEKADMGMILEAARHRLGVLLGGDEGQALRGRAEAAVRAQGVRAVERFVAMFAPGRWT